MSFGLGWSRSRFGLGQRFTLGQGIRNIGLGQKSYTRVFVIERKILRGFRPGGPSTGGLEFNQLVDRLADTGEPLSLVLLDDKGTFSKLKDVASDNRAREAPVKPDVPEDENVGVLEETLEVANEDVCLLEVDVDRTLGIEPVEESPQDAEVKNLHVENGPPLHAESSGAENEKREKREKDEEHC